MCAMCPTASCMPTCAALPMRCCRRASRRAIAWSSTCRWPPRLSWRCRPVRASAPSTPSYSAVSRRCHSRIASRMRPPCCSSLPTAAGAVARRWNSSRRRTRRCRWAARACARSSCSSAPARTSTCIRAAMCGGTTSSKASRRSANPSGSTPNIRCSCCTPPDPRASPRASSIRARAIYSAPSSPASGCSISTMTMCSGAPPTSAGSPATATWRTDRWPRAPPS